MERIRQAVEQAARDRERKSGQSATSTAKVPGAGAAVAGARVSAEEVRFTQTRNVIVSLATRKRNRLVAGIPGHPMRDTYRMLRTRVLQELKANDWNVIAVTSPATGSGKTLTAINMAISLAMDLSHLVLLVDGDLRNPSVHKYFNYKPEFGLNDVLFNDVPLSSVLFHPDIDRLTILPGCDTISESAEALASPRTVALMQELRSRYADRIIVVDIPPVLSVDDALALAPNVDCMLMVTESGETTRDDLYKAMDLLDGIPILGTVLNKSDKKVVDIF